MREVKVHSPDYKGVEADEVFLFSCSSPNIFSSQAITDFLERIKHYEEIYEPISEEDESHFSFIKVCSKYNLNTNTTS